MSDPKTRKRSCVVCADRAAEGHLLCGPCGRSYDAATDRDVTIDACIRWAAGRARRFERARRRRGGQP